MYTANGAPYDGYSQPDAYAPQPGQAIMPKPVTPMRTEAVLSSGSTNMCQAGLPDASRYRCDWPGWGASRTGEEGTARAERGLGQSR